MSKIKQNPKTIQDDREARDGLLVGHGLSNEWRIVSRIHNSLVRHLSEDTGLTPTRTSAILHDLANKGKIERTGNDRGLRFRLLQKEIDNTDVDVTKVAPASSRAMHAAIREIMRAHVCEVKETTTSEAVAAVNKHLTPPYADAETAAIALKWSRLLLSSQRNLAYEVIDGMTDVYVLPTKGPHGANIYRLNGASPEPSTADDVNPEEPEKPVISTAAPKPKKRVVDTILTRVAIEALTELRDCLHEIRGYVREIREANAKPTDVTVRCLECDKITRISSALFESYGAPSCPHCTGETVYEEA